MKSIILTIDSSILEGKNPKDYEDNIIEKYKKEGYTFVGIIWI